MNIELYMPFSFNVLKTKCQCRGHNVQRCQCDKLKDLMQGNHGRLMHINNHLTQQPVKNYIIVAIYNLKNICISISTKHIILTPTPPRLLFIGALKVHLLV